MSRPKPVVPVPLFLDHCLAAKSLARSLDADGVEHYCLKDVFPTACPDVDWLPEVATKGWLVVSADDRIRYRQHEQLAVAATGARLFLIANGGEKRGVELVEIVRACLRPMFKLARRTPAPFIAKLHEGGRIEMWMDSTALADALARARR